MQDLQQFKQLMLQYDQLKNGSLEIARLIEIEDFDSAMTLLKSREATFLNCKCMRKFLKLTPEQDKELNNALDELKVLEMSNITMLQERMKEVKQELRRSQQTEKIQQAYDFGDRQKGSIVNFFED